MWWLGAVSALAASLAPQHFLEPSQPGVAGYQPGHTVALAVPPSGARFAVVRPFCAKDAHILAQQLADDNTACSRTFAEVDLLLYSARDWNKEAMVEFRNLVSVSPVKKCFRHIALVSADLSDEQDTYPRGPCEQFYHLFERGSSPVLGKYEAFFMMEPDVKPIKDHWLDDVYHTLRFLRQHEELWIVGARYDNRDVPEEELPKWPAVSDGHVNGNAYYSLSHSEFINAANAYHNNTGCLGPEAWYDYRMYQWLKEAGHEFKYYYTDHIAHAKAGMAWDPVLPIQEVRARYPEAYLFHGHVDWSGPGGKQNASLPKAPKEPDTATGVKKETVAVQQEQEATVAYPQNPRVLPDLAPKPTPQAWPVRKENVADKENVKELDMAHLMPAPRPKLVNNGYQQERPAWDGEGSATAPAQQAAAEPSATK